MAGLLEHRHAAWEELLWALDRCLDQTPDQHSDRDRDLKSHSDLNLFLIRNLNLKYGPNEVQRM